ncbi:bifunctional phosphoribosylaminoimidazolecarboxamide formyltransferase/IMP cyclohydrolase [candidate division KSB3 bacterium]|uniref:Bifunctional purine biosynthesis protein PurH n=1 Tax=candidate division KSB3 bacterium TaxID=2044937 RepID=A0A9D5Q6G5_9BACT|nr:bifunctional phosphoribosylaminoimidazolecarboxamide formyltransferase/IMP cyclohydrolase [candidate division KSB3 bacterium]MBD3325227.1 bifunctional phosphoribosylaminoimidazolecarboxamide formyltransferase/IMP cyclohydrolase [candidate division KSB3 bacterium]
MITIRRALLSVSDKTGLIPLARELHKHGCELISTGGTGKALQENGIPIIDIQAVTGNPEAFGGRMKTISFTIESALLFDREKDKAEAEALEIQPIDMVICNLYPFKKVLDSGADEATLIENIDIGGPTMIRAGAKNFKYVAVVTDVTDYDQIIQELQANQGSITLATRKKLMRKAFKHTADYDAVIATAMDHLDGEESLRMTFTGGKTLRYGENSHQNAVYYREKAAGANSLYDMKVLHGKELSFNNILDIHGAIESVRRLQNVGCSVIKHTNPCGLCEGINQRDVFEAAWAGDPVSAFGSIIAFNCAVERDTVEFLYLDAEDRSQRKFVEVIVAPTFSEDALAYLKLHKDLRVIEYDTASNLCDKDIRYFNGSLLVQDSDLQLHSKLDPVTEIKPDIAEKRPLIEFGLTAISNIKSNSIILVREKGGLFQLLGMGAGQPNRLISTKLALDKSRETLTNEYTGDPDQLEAYIKTEIGNAIMVSDAFFPFPDNVELASEYGVKTITQPGGSLRDNAVIEACNRLGIAMIFTGLRHFKH